ncbi:peptidase S24/S26A/S26B/S26C [Ochromonadaceae sp. CCMP2298]|nr:peptidase S24/S26A/S26B/S26C [Ochromonadaceae sp. CCMP2298]
MVASSAWLGLLLSLFWCSLSAGREGMKVQEVQEMFNRSWVSPWDISDVRDKLYVGSIFVPVIGRGRGSDISFLEQRFNMFEAGVYPGVEYEVLQIECGGRRVQTLLGMEVLRDPARWGAREGTGGKRGDGSSSDGGGGGGFGGDLSGWGGEREERGPVQQVEQTKQVERVQREQVEEGTVELLIKPHYPLIKQLERDWPVTTTLSQIPFVATRGSYNTITVAGSAALALGLFAAATLLSQALTLSVVNSRSMMPTIQPKDVILVEKVTPSLSRGLFKVQDSVCALAGSVQGVCDTADRSVVTPGEVVFFAQPDALRRYISRYDLPPIRGGDLLVKRVYGNIATTTAPTGVPAPLCVEVRGDNPSASLDSRQFGCFPDTLVVGRPLGIVWPPARIGPLKPLMSR